MDIPALVRAQRTYFQTGATLPIQTRQAALDKLAELGRPTPTPVPTPVTVTVTSDSDEHPEIADAIKDGSWGQPASPTPAPAAQVPQTGDSFHLGLVVLLLGASLCGITACLVALRRKKN